MEIAGAETSLLHCVPMFPPRVAALLREQHGLVARWQLLDDGVPAATVNTWVTRGHLEVLERGVYRLHSAARPPVQDILAAVLRCGPEARAGGWTARALHGLEGFSLGAKRWVVIPPCTRVRGVRFIVQRTLVAPRDEDVVSGVPTVSASRAIIDTATRTAGKRLRVAIDDARRRNLLSLRELMSLAGGMPKYVGAAEIRRMFSSGALDQDGEAERWLAVGLAERGVFPLWSAQVLPGIFPDAAMPEASLILECDGGEHHTLLSDRAYDASRESLLRADGWEILRFSGTRLRRDLRGVVDQVVRMRQQRIDAGRGKPLTWRPLSPGRRLRPPAA